MATRETLKEQRCRALGMTSEEYDALMDRVLEETWCAWVDEKRHLLLPPGTPLHFVPYPAPREYIEGGFDTHPPNSRDEQDWDEQE